MKQLIKSRGTDVDVERCRAALDGNQFTLVLLASARARQIRADQCARRVYDINNPVVTALLEIQQGKFQ
jgi:DNA-directed RNA polymerase subunit K/omega